MVVGNCRSIDSRIVFARLKMPKKDLAKAVNSTLVRVEKAVNSTLVRVEKAVNPT